MGINKLSAAVLAGAATSIMLLAQPALGQEVAPRPNAAGAAGPSAAESPSAPRADHHTHLISPAAAIRAVPPLAPPVAVPADLKQLLDARVAAVGDEAKMTALFVDPVRVLHPLYPIWLEGAEALETVASTPKDYVIVPSFIRRTPASAFLGGTWLRGEGDKRRPITNFFIYAEKVGKTWKIAAEGFTAKGPPLPKAVTADRLIGELDAAGIAKAAVLSIAYQVEPEPGDGATAEYARVRAENDWVVGEAARYPGRLSPVCGVNPLKPFAVAEVRRCAGLPRVHAIKLHLGNARLDLRDPAELAALQAVVREADAKRLSIVIHLRTARNDYGMADAAIFLGQVAPLAPHVAIQIAHLAGAGPGLDSDPALAVFADAISANDPRAATILFDVASVVTADSSPAARDKIAARLRQLGMNRILFGSDRSAGNEPPQQAWQSFLTLPLRADEFAAIAANVAPYLRD